MWQNFLNDDDSVDISLDLFEKDGENYFRASESFSEIAIPLDEIKNMLCESGFEVLGVYDGYEDRGVSDNSERAVFVARKSNR